MGDAFVVERGLGAVGFIDDYEIAGAGDPLEMSHSFGVEVERQADVGRMDLSDLNERLAVGEPAG